MAFLLIYPESLVSLAQGGVYIIIIIFVIISPLRIVLLLMTTGSWNGDGFVWEESGGL